MLNSISLKLMLCHLSCGVHSPLLMEAIRAECFVFIIKKRHFKKVGYFKARPHLTVHRKYYVGLMIS